MTDVIAYGTRQEYRSFPKHNPFYLLSAACMLTGCLLLSNTTTWSPIALRRLLTLLITVNAYELLLLGLALFLAARHIIRDAGMLLVLQAIFMTDVVFLNAEIVGASYGVGVAINALLLVLTLTKLEVIRRVAGVRVTAAQVIFCVVQIVFLFALPIVLQSLSSTKAQFYGLWWAVGLLPAGYEMLTKIIRHTIREDDMPGEPRPVRASLYLALPWMSLVLHLGILHYVHNTTWLSPMLAPVMLGLAIVVRRLAPRPGFPREQQAGFAVLLCVIAVIVSTGNPESLSLRLLGCKIGPLAFTLVATYLLMIYWFAPRYALWLIGGAAMLMTSYTLGPSRSDIVDFLQDVLNWTFATLTPSVAGLGFIGLCLSFVLLAVGAWFSLRVTTARPRVAERLPENPAPPHGGPTTS